MSTTLRGPLTTPIAFIIFNRPEKTRRVFEEIRHARPSRLFIIADGARNEAEEKICKATRAIVETIDWDCEVFRNYSERNLGCKVRVSSGISWVFESVDRAIFLEDDCLPNSDFFTFCDELLDRYKDDKRIMHISGDNFQQQNKGFECNESYFFATIPHVWGWATWRRAWELYDRDIVKWPDPKSREVLAEMLPDPVVRERWELVFSRYYNQTIDSWDGQWVFTCLTHRGLSINPKYNLVQNIGFDAESTHAFDPNDLQANVPSHGLPFPLIHPTNIVANEQADAFTYKYIYHINHYLGQRVRSFFRLRFPYFYSTLKKLVGSR